MIDTTYDWQALAEELDGDVHIDMTYRGAYATDASIFQRIPTAVIWPKHAEDCKRVMAFCQENDIALIGRGGGTSLSGQTITNGIVLDCSRYMNHITNLDLETCTIQVEPGVVLQHLNNTLKPHNYHFPPDPATASRATLGGMIANNSCGTRSIIYGRTGDYIQSLRVLLPSGDILDLTRHDAKSWQDICRTSHWHETVDDMLKDPSLQQEITERFPKIPRRVAGYALDAFLNTDNKSLIDLFVGSEGTLGIILEATLSICPLPTHTSLCVAHFEHLFDAVRNVPELVKLQPSAVELLDSIVIQESLHNPSTAHLASSLRTDGDTPAPGAVLLIEFFSDNDADATQKLEQCQQALQQMTGYQRSVKLTEKSAQQQVWDLRRLGLGLISNQPGVQKGIAFVEDACVPLDTLSEYTEYVYQLCEDKNVPISTYAHASVGVLHFRPMLDMHVPEQQQLLKEIGQKCFEKVLKLGGIFSSEHGDGLIRGGYIAQQFGDTLYQVMIDIKQLFDPNNRCNPGCKIESTWNAQDTRYGQSDYEIHTQEIGSHFDYGTQKNLVGAIEQCNGIGACRKLQGGTMCPSYRATQDETQSTRGRANLLRLAISGQLPDGGLSSPTLHQALDLCLSCKACKSECPNAVDISKLKAEALQARYDLQGTPKWAKFVASSADRLNMMTGWRASIANAVGKKIWFKKQLEKRYGFDPRRPLPTISHTSLEKMLNQQGLPDHKNGLPDVALFVDQFTRRLEPWIAFAAIELIQSLGYNVHILKNHDAQRPRISCGMLREAAFEGVSLWHELVAYTEKGMPIVGIDPGEVSALQDDLPALQDLREQANSVSQNIHRLDTFVWQAIQKSRAQLSPAPKFKERKIMLHRHCHEKADSVTSSIANILELANIQTHAPDTGCCGMAGSFGYRHYDLSMKIAEETVFPAIRQAQQRGMPIIATGSSCRQQIRDGLNQDSYHWAEIIRVNHNQ